MKINRLTNSAVKQAAKQSPLRVLSDEDLMLATGGMQPAPVRCYRYSASVLAAPSRP